MSAKPIDKLLYKAVLSSSSFENIESLIELGADVNYQNEDGDSLILKLVKSDPNKYFNEIDLLVKAGANLNIKDSYKRFPLYYLLFEYPYSGVNNFDILQKLIPLFVNYGAPIDAFRDFTAHLLRFGCFKLAIDYLAKEQDEQIKKKYIENGLLTINYSHNGAHLMVKYLLEQGADPNKPDRTSSKLPIYEAARRGNFESVKLLIDYGADVNKTIYYYDTPNSALDCAFYGGNIKVCQLIIDSGFKMNLDSHINMFSAIVSQNLQTLKLCIDLGFDVNQKNKGNSTPLHEAIERQNLEMAELLITNGSEINVQDNRGHTPLHYAINLRMKPKPFLAKVLCPPQIIEKPIEFNADLEDISFQLVKLLVDNGADVNIQNKEGYLALHYAICSESKKIVDFLLQYHQIESLGQVKPSLLDYASEVKEYQLYAFLKKVGIKNI